MRFIEHCHTPVLVLHGDADQRVPTFQGEEFSNGLRLLGRPAEFVRYPREPRIFAERDHQTDLLQRILDFLRRMYSKLNGAIFLFLESPLR